MSTSMKCLRSATIGTATVVVGGYSAPTVTTGVVITGLVCVNRTGSNISVNISLIQGSDSQANTYLINNATILPGGSLTLADEGNRIVLNATNQITASSNVAGSLDVTMSVAEIT